MFFCGKCFVYNDREPAFVGIAVREYAHKRTEFLTQLKEDILSACGICLDFFEQEVQAVLRLHIIFEFIFEGLRLKFGKFFDFLAQRSVFVLQLFNGLHDIGWFFEQGFDLLELSGFVFVILHGGLASDGFYAANACGNGTFCDQFKHADLVGVGHVDATAKFDGWAKFNDANGVAVFFAEKGHGPFLLGAFNI